MEAGGQYGFNQGSYTLHVREWDTADDFTAGTDTGGRLAVGGSANGRIELPATATGSR